MGGREWAGEVYLVFKPSCLWDCGDFNGVVGVTDFLAVLAQWGMTGTACDFGNPGVNIQDFLALLANWGPCPTP